MKPKMPSRPTGTSAIRAIAPEWMQGLWDAVNWSINNIPRGDGLTILNQPGGTLRAIGGRGGGSTPEETVYDGPFACLPWGNADAYGKILVRAGKIHCINQYFQVAGYRMDNVDIDVTSDCVIWFVIKMRVQDLYVTMDVIPVPTDLSSGLNYPMLWDSSRTPQYLDDNHVVLRSVPLAAVFYTEKQIKQLWTTGIIDYTMPYCSDFAIYATWADTVYVRGGYVYFGAQSCYVPARIITGCSGKTICLDVTYDSSIPNVSPEIVSLALTSWTSTGSPDLYRIPLAYVGEDGVTQYHTSGSVNVFGRVYP